MYMYMHTLCMQYMYICVHIVFNILFPVYQHNMHQTQRRWGSCTTNSSNSASPGACCAAASPGLRCRPRPARWHSGCPMVRGRWFPTPGAGETQDFGADQGISCGFQWENHEHSGKILAKCNSYVKLWWFNGQFYHSYLMLFQIISG